VLIKIGLRDLPALTFAGMRYCLAFLCQLLLALRPTLRVALAGLRWQDWARLIMPGLLFYAVTQGLYFWGWPTCLRLPSACY